VEPWKSVTIQFFAMDQNQRHCSNASYDDIEAQGLRARDERKRANEKDKTFLKNNHR
jgi:hypothetical protein